MQKFYKIPDDASMGTPVIGNNSEVFNRADPVTIDANGNLKVAAATEKIIGYATDDVTMASDNETVAKVCPNYIQHKSGLQMVYTSDQDCTQTDVGAYADLTGTTGAIQVNLAAGSTGQFLVLGFDPDGDGTANLVIVEASEPQSMAFAQS